MTYKGHLWTPAVTTVTNMFHLPTELLLQILSFLPIRLITSLRLVSHDWDTLITENEVAVYHAAAVLHDFAKPHQQLQKSKGNDAFPLLEGVASWKELCGCIRAFS